MKKLIVAFYIILISSLLCFGQGESQYSLNFLNHMTINPGYAGSQDAIEVNGLFRDQWMGFGEGRPRTQVFNINTPFNFIGRKHGAALVLINDASGFFKNNAINLSYAYRQELGQGTLGTGFSVGFVNQTLTPTYIFPDESGASDPFVPAGGDDKPMVFNLGLGSFYQTDNLYLGFSVSNLNSPKVKWQKSQSGASAPFNTPVKPNFYIFGGYDYQLINPLYEIQPNLAIYSDGVSTQFNISGVLKYNKRFWGGLNFRTVEGFSLMFGMEFLNGVHFGAAYDVITSKLRGSTFGSMEFLVGYSFSIDIEKDKRLYKSIRFL